MAADPPTNGRLRIAVGIVTTGRPEVVPEVLAELSRQHRPPDRLIVCHAAPGDVAGCATGAAELLLSPPGIAVQRNRVLDAAGDCDVVVFFDDDFLPRPEWLARVERVFMEHPGVAVVTGALIADGINGPGISPSAARALLHADARDDRDGDGIAAAPNGYGCNMALRLAPLRAHGLRFDERLPLYGWLEDVDLTRRAGAHGAIVRCMAARGVHMGVKRGRGSGRRLGYSQIANPLYIARKGALPWSHALGQISRNVAANLVRSLWPEPWVDRRGRLAGNLLAVADMLRRRLAPERVLGL